MIWLAMMGCWAVSFVFAGIEAGLLSVDPVRLRHHVKLGEPPALQLDRLIKQPERLLVTVLLVTNFADILALFLLAGRLVRHFGHAGYVFTFLLALPIYLFLVGVLPKAIFRRFPYRALAALAGVLEFSSTLLAPLLAVGARLGRFFLRAKMDEPPRIFAAREELKQITVQREREGSLTATERAMIHNVVDFGSVRVEEVMIPLARAISVPPGVSCDAVLELSRTSGVDRLPVIDAEGHALGLINALDLLLDTGARKPLAFYIRRLVTTRTDEPAPRIIRRLRAARLTLAAVLDSQRRLVGFVTVEDLIKRLVRHA